MKTRRPQNAVLFTVSALFIAVVMAFGQGTAPELSITTSNATHLSIALSNLSAGATYYLEQNDNLLTNTWAEVHQFEGISGETNWISTTSNAGFYRAIRDPYHAKVGQSATFGPPTFHQVAGTAHILNNQTIELRNFSYDGDGIVVQVYVSPNDSFSPYTVISDDLFGTSFSNETVVLQIPQGADLDTFNYISIWCVAAGVSFGDGPFQ